MSEAARVLVIDDDAAFRFAMVKALSRRGFAVERGAERRGRAARAAAGRSPPDAALLDLRMGGIDGLEVLRALRARAARASSC